MANKIYIIQYTFNKDGIYTMDTKNDEHKTETFTSNERDTWLRRYQEVSKDSLYKKELKSFFVKLCTKDVYELDDEKMQKIIDGI